MTRNLSLPLLLAAMMIPGLASADTEIYTWVDANGTRHFSQEGSSVPSRGVDILRFPDRPQAEPVAAPVDTGRSVVPVETERAVPTVKGQVNGTDTEFVVDTGASVTVLNRDFAESLGLDMRGVGPAQVLDTAQGSILGTPVHLDTLRIGDAEMDDVAAVVVDSDEVPNLLGRNFLDQFEVTLDPREQVMVLRSVALP